MPETLGTAALAKCAAAAGAKGSIMTAMGHGLGLGLGVGLGLGAAFWGPVVVVSVASWLFVARRHIDRGVIDITPERSGPP